MNYFELVDSMRIADRWHLSAPSDSLGRELDPRLFTEGIAYDGVAPLTVRIREGQHPLAFSFGSFEMPIVTQVIADCLRPITGKDVQFIPVNIVGYEKQTFCVLNILTAKECLDESQSEISYWTADDDFPDRTGSIFGIARIVLRKSAIGDAQMFRIKRWLQPIILAERVRNALDDLQVTGVDFRRIETK